MCLGRHQRRTSCSQRSLTFDAIEASVELEWSTTKLDPKYAELLQSMIVDELGKKRESVIRQSQVSTRWLQVLTTEREKLLHAHYAGAVPVEMLKTEMSRISNEMSDHEQLVRNSQRLIGDVDRFVNAAVEFLESASEKYLAAGPTVRREMNHGMFKRVLVSDEGDVNSELIEPFKSLLDPDLLTVIGRKPRRAGTAAWIDGIPGWLQGHSDWKLWCRWIHERVGESIARPNLLGLGLTNARLAVPTGFEPVPPP